MSLQKTLFKSKFSIIYESILKVLFFDLSVFIIEEFISIAFFFISCFYFFNGGRLRPLGRPQVKICYHKYMTGAGLHDFITHVPSGD